MPTYENFISYRRKDTSAEVQALYSALQERGFLTFCDVHSLPAGRIDDGILLSIKNCTNFILVLGENSLNGCEQKNDWLRLEISEALRCNKNIICVVVGKFEFPTTLPDDISEIKILNRISFDFINFETFIDKLIDRFLVSIQSISCTNPERDFVIEDGKLIKYIGTASIVSIPETVFVVCKQAFKDKTFITSITFSENVSEIEEEAFERCNKLTNLTFPKSLKIINRRAFYRCYSLAYVSLNQELEIIEEEAFAFCSKIKLIQFGKSIKKIDSSAFNGCVHLIHFLVDADNPYYCDVEGILYTKDLKTLVRCGQNYDLDVINIPKEVENISAWAFSQCITVVDISLPKRVKTIGEYAFRDCTKIRSLTIDKNITKFSISAIDGWSSRQQIITSRGIIPLIKYQIEQKLKEEIVQEASDISEELIFVKVTFESEDEAMNMAKMLSFKKIIGSAQIYPINTIYMWEEELCNEREYELSCITRKNLFSNVEYFIHSHHSYGLCEVIAVPIIHTSEKFEKWIKELTNI